MLIDIDRLKTLRPALYESVVMMIGYNSGVREVNLHAFSEPRRKYIAEAEVTPPPAPAPPKVLPPQIDVRALLEEQQADALIAADEQRARNRLNEYAAAGLVDSHINVGLIQGWLRENGKPLTSTTVDEAILALNAKLDWKEEATPASTSPATPAAEVLQPWQLPLTASEADMKRADVKAVKDLLARRRSASGQVYNRGAGSQRVGSTF
jgi:hypothetical protein